MTTGTTSLLHGLKAMKPLPGLLQSASLEDLFSELTKRLSDLESLGLLSGNGKSLKSLLPQAMPTPFTDGSVPKKEDYVTSTSLLALDGAALQEGLWKARLGGATQCTSLGPGSLQGTLSNGYQAQINALESL